jgi:hypothetical protein
MTPTLVSWTRSPTQHRGLGKDLARKSGCGRSLRWAPVFHCDGVKTFPRFIRRVRGCRNLLRRLTTCAPDARSTLAGGRSHPQCIPGRSRPVLGRGCAIAGGGHAQASVAPRAHRRATSGGPVLLLVPRSLRRTLTVALRTSTLAQGGGHALDRCRHPPRSLGPWARPSVDSSTSCWWWPSSRCWWASSSVGESSRSTRSTVASTGPVRDRALAVEFMELEVTRCAACSWRCR